MTTESEATDLKRRIQRMEDWVKTLRWMLAGAGVFWGPQIWFSIHPTLFQANTIRARNVTIVDEKGNRVALLGSENGVSFLSFYDANHKSKAQIAVSEAQGPKIILFDKDQHQRALLEVTETSQLVLHSPDNRWLRRDSAQFGFALRPQRKTIRAAIRPVCAYDKSSATFPPVWF